MAWGEYFVTAVMCKLRSGVCGLNVFIKEQSDKDGHTEHSLSIELSYNPFKIALVTPTQSEIGSELYTIISGSDSKTHCNSHAVYNTTYAYIVPIQNVELEVLAKNPALLDLATPVTALITSSWISGYQMALGCQDGLVKLLRCPLNGEEPQVTSIHLDGPISSVLLLRIRPSITDLLVTSASGYACYFSGVSTKQLKHPLVIVPPSRDSLTSSVACDVDFDGEKEVLLGSYSQEVYCYKLVQNAFQLLWTLRFEHPVMAVGAVDFNMDGLLEVCVVSMYGVSIYRPNFAMALTKLERVKKYLRDSESHPSSFTGNDPFSEHSS